MASTSRPTSAGPVTVTDVDGLKKWNYKLGLIHVSHPIRWTGPFPKVWEQPQVSTGQHLSDSVRGDVGDSRKDNSLPNIKDSRGSVTSLGNEIFTGNEEGNAVVTQGSDLPTCTNANKEHKIDEGSSGVGGSERPSKPYDEGSNADCSDDRLVLASRRPDFNNAHSPAIKFTPPRRIDSTAHDFEAHGLSTRPADESKLKTQQCATARFITSIRYGPA
ncbi:MAG: hypothetical protein Q9171_001549 [Xanthocarpia ochracea]